MIKRNLLESLKIWSNSRYRKPLVIRGARQVGKTTLVREFAKEFEVFIPLNLERDADRRLFDQAQTPAQLMSILSLTRIKHKFPERGRILLFIDEIQSEPKAIGMLRYFYEELPEVFVIAAGSRLQELFKSGVSFPVGRVEYLTLRPCFFDEFLEGMGYVELRKKLVEFEDLAAFHPQLMQLFTTYSLIGGMPEVISRYSEQPDIMALSPLFKGLLQSYDEDVEKYAFSKQQIGVLRHLLRRGWDYAGQTISFARFAGSEYRSDSVHEAFELLERAFLVSLDYPSVSVRLPVQESRTRSPKLVWLDSGLVNFSAGIQVEYLTNSDLVDVWRGHAIEQIIGQELRAPMDRNYIDIQNYWVRDKRGSTAEIDYVYPFNGHLIPIEIKSGRNSHLRSIHTYMVQEGAPEIAIRVWPGPLQIDEATSSPESKSFRLISIPYYLVGQLDKILLKYASNFRQLITP